MIGIYIIGNALLIFFNIYYYILFARIIFSWFQSAMYGNSGLQSIYRILYGLTEPVLAPLRQVLPSVRVGMGYLDLSPIVLLLLLFVARELVVRFFF